MSVAANVSAHSSPLLGTSFASTDIVRRYSPGISVFSMRTAFVTSSVSRDAGGLFFAMTRLARSLHDRGCEVIAHGVADAHSAQDMAAWEPVACHAHPRRGPAALAWSPDLEKALSSGSYDLAHTHGLWQWPSAAVHNWHRRRHQPYLVSPHGMLDPWALANSRWKKQIAAVWYESAHLRDAACLHALCQSEADAIRAYGLKSPVCIIPNGVDLVDAETLKGEKKTLLFLGRLHPKKGLPNALRAWKQALHSTFNIENSTSHEWQFVVAGWDQGGHEAELKRLCDELGLKWADMPAAEFVGGADASQERAAPLATSGRAAAGTPYRSTETPASVIFTGPAFGATKDALLRNASAFILPSFSEGLPMSVLEAWSYRLPVLMTDHCNIPEGFAADAAIRIDTGIRGQESGVRGQGAGDRDQPMGIDEGMRALIEMTDEERIAMGQNGRALVEQHFTWPQVAAQMKEVYEWVLGGGAKPSFVRD